MTWDTVPWFVGGGAEHSPEVARLMAYVAFRGNEGVLGAGDLKVQALATPGGSVRVMPGAASILCRASGQSSQAYAGRNPSEDVVAVAPTGSGGGRSDLVVARVEDPNLAGEPWAAPSDPKVGPYVFTRIISGVPAGTIDVASLNLGYSAIPLARIDIPASTATITDAMIVDLRKVANPRTSRTLLTAYPATVNDLTSEASPTAWPTAATSTLAIPSWATQAVIRGTVASALLGANYWNGAVRINLGGLTTQESGVDQNWTGNPARFDVMVGGTLAIPANLRGTSQTIKFEGRMGSRGTGAYVRADTYTTTVLDVEFIESAA